MPISMGRISKMAYNMRDLRNYKGMLKTKVGLNKDSYLNAVFVTSDSRAWRSGEETLNRCEDIIDAMTNPDNKI